EAGEIYLGAKRCGSERKICHRDRPDGVQCVVRCRTAGQQKSPTKPVGLAVSATEFVGPGLVNSAGETCWRAACRVVRRLENGERKTVYNPTRRWYHTKK